MGDKFGRGSSFVQSVVKNSISEQTHKEELIDFNDIAREQMKDNILVFKVRRKIYRHRIGLNPVHKVSGLNFTTS